MSTTIRVGLDGPNQFVLYHYHPSQVAAIVFVIAFSGTVGLHILQCIRARTWFFIPLIVGGLLEIIGYIGRAISANDQWAVGPYIIQSMTLLVAPAFCAASIYMSLGRIILATGGERYSVVRKKWLTKIFVTGDVIAILMQSAGGGIMASGTLSAMEKGQKVVVAGLFVQLAFFGYFMYASGRFYLRMNRACKTREIYTDVAWRKHCWVLLAASLVIFIRSTFRVVEYCSGNDGYLLRHEIYLYMFDACCMLFVFAVYNGVHPGEIAAALSDPSKQSENGDF